MKRNWKNIAAALLILAGTAQAGASTPNGDRNPGGIKEAKAGTPVVQARGNRVFVNLLNLDGQPVTVKVYDNENRLLYVQSIAESPVVEKAFNFEEAYEGTYSVVVRDGETVYSASVEITR